MSDQETSSPWPAPSAPWPAPTTGTNCQIEDQMVLSSPMLNLLMSEVMKKVRKARRRTPLPSPTSPPDS